MEQICELQLAPQSHDAAPANLSSTFTGFYYQTLRTFFRFTPGLAMRNLPSDDLPGGLFINSSRS